MKNIRNLGIAAFVLLVFSALLAVGSKSVLAYGTFDSAAGPTETYLDLSRGIVKRMDVFTKFGRNTGASDTEEDIWAAGGTWVAPTQARVHNITSSVTTDTGSTVLSGTASGGTTVTMKDNAVDFVSVGVSTGDLLINDTQDIYGVISAVNNTGVTVFDLIRDGKIKEGSREFAFEQGDSYRVISHVGSGATAVLIEGLDSNYEEQYEIVELQGTENIPTANSYKMLNRIAVIHAGSGTLANGGNITATAQTDNTVTLQINAGKGTCHCAVYQIPAGKIGYIVAWNADMNKSQANANVDVSLKFQPVGGVFQTFYTVGLLGAGDNSFFRRFAGGLRLPPMTTVKMSALASTSGVDVSGGFDIVLEDID